MQNKDERQLNALRAAITSEPNGEELNALFPVIVPQDFIKLGNWPGPYATMKCKEFVLTWAILKPEQTMLYLNNERQILWDKQQIPWKEIAVKNLKEAGNIQLWSHEKKNEDGKLIFVVTMHEDGLGPSRLLLSKMWSKTFPMGYRIAIPERSCGVAFPADLYQKDLDNVLGFVKNCYNSGTSPMSERVFSPEELLSIT